jgi:hypothetical protein
MAIKPQIFKLWCEYRFKPPSLVYYDVRNEVGGALLDGYKHWSNDGTKITLVNPENRRVLAIEHNRLVLEFDIPDSPDDLESKFNQALKEYTKRVPVKTYIRVGVRMQSMVPLEFKFSEIVAIAKEKLLPNEERLTKIIGSKVTDFMYNVITDNDGASVHLICGPVKKDEIPRWYQSAAMILDPGEKAKEINYPDVALFIDCDYYSDEPKPQTVEGFVGKAVRAVGSITTKIAEHVLGD